MKYVLIDGNNLAIRSAFGQEDLTNSIGIPTGVHYGVFQSLINIKNKFPEHQFLVVWDGKSKRRVTEASEGVEKGLIKSGYKENRDKGDDQPKPLMDFYEQAPFLKRAIEKLGVPQIRIPEFEADDVIGSYCKQLDSEDIVVVTSDNDYYQLLAPNVTIWDGMKQQVVIQEEWEKEQGITPSQFIDCGALMGDSGDNIFGIPGWGEKGSKKAIQDHGSYQGVLKHLHSLFDPIREEYPDVTGEEFERLRNLRTPKEQEKFDNKEPWKGKYPDIYDGIPFGGVALAFEEKTWKPKEKELKSGFKANILALMFEERVALAYSLKKIDCDIEGLPSIIKGSYDHGSILEYFDYYDIYSLKEDVKVFEE